MGHHHSHGHDHSHGSNKKALLIAFLLTFSFMIAEVIGGLLTNSLALLSDAGHMLSDAASLALSLFAFKLGEKEATPEKTYGYKRFEILAALFNGFTLIAISLYIFWEAYQRFQEPPAVLSTGMMWIALLGLMVNIVAAWVLMRGNTKENLNMRSAFLHVLGDMLGSIGAIAAALLIMFFGWNIADPIASVIVAVLILISAWRVTKESFHILMEGAPSHISCSAVEKTLLSIPEVISIHDLHVWTITSGYPSLSCHLVVTESADHEKIINQTSLLLDEQFGITHTTLQIEGENFSLQENNIH
jgi:cobalt-zinc-cadmium efflux system protein